MIYRLIAREMCSLLYLSLCVLNCGRANTYTHTHRTSLEHAFFLFNVLTTGASGELAAAVELLLCQKTLTFLLFVSSRANTLFFSSSLGQRKKGDEERKKAF